MPTISLCMIVKNEEKHLARCLDTVQDLMDEIIIVDTGSADRTKEIAARYTDRIYDFAWIDDFSAARNFAFSMAGCDYIYSADADEVLDEENHEKFRLLKENLLPEIEIVQMYYGNQLSFGTVYNFDRELRPKLFKRLRTFQYEDPIHEIVRTMPVIYDSDIEITHKPHESHAERDLAAFRRLTEKGTISDRLLSMYARELYLSGTEEDLLLSEDYFTERADSGELELDHLKEAVCVIVRAARLRGDYLKMYRYAMKDIASEGVSEVCCELGNYYEQAGLLTEAVIWYYNACHETEAILDIRMQKQFPLEKLAECYERLGNQELADQYRKEAQEEE